MNNFQRLLAWLFIARLYVSGRHVMIRWIPWNPLTWVFIIVLAVISLPFAALDRRASVIDYFQEIVELFSKSRIPTDYRPVWPWELR